MHKGRRLKTSGHFFAGMTIRSLTRLAHLRYLIAYDCLSLNSALVASQIVLSDGFHIPKYSIIAL